MLYGIAYLARIATIALGTRRGIAQVAVIALVVNVALNLVFIPQYGFMAAAASTFATEVVNATLLFILFVRAAGGFKAESFIAVPLVAGATMAGVLWIGGLSGAGVLIIGSIVYAVALAAGALLLAPDTTKRAVQLLRRSGGR